MPAALSTEGLVSPTDYTFFVRISERQQAWNYTMLWEGFLPFRERDDLDGTLPAYTHLQKISCNINDQTGREVLPKILHKWQSLNEILESRDSGRANEATEAAQDLWAVTVVAFPNAAQSGVPRLVVSTRAVVSGAGSDDRLLDWDLCLQNVATHSHDEQTSTWGLYGIVDVSFRTENLQLTELSLNHYHLRAYSRTRRRPHGDDRA